MEEERKEQEARGRSRRQQETEGQKKKMLLPIVVSAVLVLTLAVAGTGVFLYTREANKYVEAFFPNTAINGLDASGKTAEEIKNEIASGIDGYTLTIRGRDGKTETITWEDIALRSEFDGSLEAMLAKQVPKEWYRHSKEGSSYEIETMIVYDSELLDQKLDSLELFSEKTMVMPESAKISEYDSGIKGYSIIPAVQGSKLLTEPAKKAVADAIMTLKTEIDLDEAGCYEKPQIEADDEGLKETVNTLNLYTGAVVTHTFGDAKEVLDGDRIHEWLSVNGNEVTLDANGVTEYVKELASKYNTAYKAKKLKTSYGQTVTISSGNYGWRINQSKEAEEVLAVIRAGEQKTREPEYSQKAASHGANDYGDTYVEINLTAQHLFFYKNGKLVVESDFVSGNESRGWGTPAGAYPLTYKQRDATLTGENYKTPVSYWMPFNGGIGMHDANWRSSFGGTIYKTGGSHGCINLPPSVAKKIYEGISAGTPVLCYHLGGTASGSTSKPAETKPAETTAAVPVETTAAPTETTAAPTETTANGPVGPNSTTAAPPETQAPEGPQAPDKPPVETTAQPPAETPASPKETAAGPGFETQPEQTSSSEAAGPGF